MCLLGRKGFRVKTTTTKKKAKAESGMTPVEYLKRPYGRVVIPEADGTFRSEILEFPGCIAVGDTSAEALAALEDVAASWLESSLARGKAIPEPLECSEYSGKLVVRLPKSLHKKAAYAAERDGVSLNHFIVSSIAQQVGFLTHSASRVTNLFFQMANIGSGHHGHVLSNFNQIKSDMAILTGPAYAGS
jgi:antitoxin HicB